MRKYRFLQFVVMVVMLVSVTLSGLVVSAASADGGNDSFKASISGTLSFTGADTFELVGLVKANHIGNNQNYQATGVFTSPNTDVLVETLTAANGDKLVIQCVQELEEISPGIFRGTDSWTVIGGTGRFSNATGSGTGETIANVNAGTFTKELDGFINLPNGN